MLLGTLLHVGAAVAEPLLPAASGTAAAATTAGAETASAMTTAEMMASQSVQITDTLFTANNIWMMISIVLVFIMHLGFAGVETGFTQTKNTVNVLFKNTLTPVIGLLSYAIVGFSLMYPGEAFAGQLFGWKGLGLQMPANGNEASYAGGAFTYWTEFLFQGMFAATCATIVSGAVAERIKISAYLLFTFFYISLCYPIIGMWQWGGGFLAELGFYDFAGSTLVHSVGGWGALAGVLLLGPRIGKYAKGKVKDIPNSNVPLATIGVFLLWFGWFGFNGGSVLSADPGKVSYVLVTTSLSAAAGALGALVATMIWIKRLDLGMVLNGILAGLVGITAGADVMSVTDAVIIGLGSGMLVVLAVIAMDRLRLDDCVGAVAVHLVCGIFGTLAVGVLGSMASWQQFQNQLIGVGVCGVASFGFALTIFYVLKKTIGIRVSPKHEVEGLDSAEHGIRGYTIVFDE